MYTAMQRAKAVRQPYGGYLPVRNFTLESLGDGIETLHPQESIRPALIGKSVELLTTYEFEGATAYEHALSGAKFMDKVSWYYRTTAHFMAGGKYAHIGQKYARMSAYRTRREQDMKTYTHMDYALSLIEDVSAYTSTSIQSACRLAQYDIAELMSGTKYGGGLPSNINVDADTAENVSTMVNRSVSFLEKYGPVRCFQAGFDGAYTDIIQHAAADIVTNDTIWDMKCLKSKYKPLYTLQLLIYWRLAAHSTLPQYEHIQYIGIWNPRKNETLRMQTSEIPADIINVVDNEIIGYPANAIR